MNKSNLFLGFLLGVITTIALQHVKPIQLDETCILSDKVTVNGEVFYFGCFDRKHTKLYQCEPSINTLTKNQFIKDNEATNEETNR